MIVASVACGAVSAIAADVFGVPTRWSMLAGFAAGGAAALEAGGALEARIPAASICCAAGGAILGGCSANNLAAFVAALAALGVEAALNIFGAPAIPSLGLAASSASSASVALWAIRALSRAAGSGVIFGAIGAAARAEQAADNARERAR